LLNIISGRKEAAIWRRTKY